MTAIAERTLSEFLRHSGRVLRETGSNVVLRRREGDDLVLMPREDLEVLTELTRGIAMVVQTSPAAGTHLFPWLTLLNNGDREACLADVTEALLVTAETGRLAELQEAVNSWRHTALAVWDEKRLRERPDYGDYLQADPLPIRRPKQG